MKTSNKLSSSASNIPSSPKILVVEDDIEWCNLIQVMARTLGYLVDFANDLESVQSKIIDADKADDPFLVATIDINFEFGKKNIETPLGKEILKYIKQHYPYIACIAISGIPITPDSVLDLRDEFSLDYYIQKQKFDSTQFKHAVEKVLDRVNPLGSKEKRRSILEQSLEKWRDVYAIYSRNLAIASKREALKGIDADIGIRNEIAIYSEKLRELNKTIQEIEEELRKL